jgi:ketohexokinase
MAHILAIGIATLDIVNTLDGYPTEDTEVRALAQRVTRGGNATNSLAVLSQLGHRVSWGGVWVEEPDAQRIRTDLEHHGIDLTHCRRLPTGKVPTSYITLNVRNGSRTIVHYRDLPEYRAEDFRRIDLGRFDWLHLEGRNVAETAAMLEHARATAPHLPRSLEVEKPRPGIEALFGLADVLLFSPAYARSRACTPEALLHAVRRAAPQADLFCTAGAAGAMALERAGVLHHSRAFPPERVVDTLGAGDTFNAAVIDGCLRQLPVAELLGRACRVAGLKVGQEGLRDLPLAELQATGTEHG